MAGDWIKMRNDLANDPAVVSIASRLRIDEDSVVGKLHKVWSWADRHTTDGIALGISAEWLDRYVAKKGFAAAMQAVAWLQFDEHGLRIPKFDRHNGGCAKLRAENTERKRLSRESRDHVTDLSRDLRDKSATREEKSREEKNTKGNTNPGAAARLGPRPPIEIPSELKSAEFLAVWEEWLAYRRERRIKTTDRTIAAQLEMLSRAGPVAAIEMIRRSITNGWAGLFELDGKHARKSNAGHIYDPNAVGDI